MRKLNDNHRKILDYLKDRVHTGFPPSVREICAEVGLKSTASAFAYLKQLEEAGLITRETGQNRAIRITGESYIQVPVLGRITAGMPILAIEEVEGYVPFYAGKSNQKELFALRVMGESMIGAGILDGDIVIAKKTPTAENGQIVIALVGDEATVKRIFFDKEHIRLQPENPAINPIIVDEITVLGKVIGLVREFDGE
jgi:repressor LexA